MGEEFGGIIYAEDYSANYTERSLPDLVDVFYISPDPFLDNIKRRYDECYGRYILNDGKDFPLMEGEYDTWRRLNIVDTFSGDKVFKNDIICRGEHRRRKEDLMITIVGWYNHEFNHYDEQLTEYLS